MRTLAILLLVLGAATATFFLGWWAYDAWPWSWVLVLLGMLVWLWTRLK